MMTKAELLSTTRYLTNELSSDSGALLDDTANLLDFLLDAIEQVVLDLIPTVPSVFLATEDITLTATDNDYDLTAEFWQIFKVERYETGKAPKEIRIIDPLELQFETNTGDTEANPDACYFMGSTIYFVKTPSESKAYARVYYIKPEATTLATDGPAVLPRITHRLIPLYAAALIAETLGSDPSKFLALYAMKLNSVRKVLRGRYQQSPRFVRPGARERQMIDERHRAFNDISWLD
jgi:hypothetical protein